MTQRLDVLDLGRLGLTAGEGRRIDAPIALDGLKLGGETYAVGDAGGTDARLDVSRMRNGWALRLRFEAELEGPCMRCLEPARRAIEVDAREVDQPEEENSGDGGEDLTSPYLSDEELDVRSWARDALALALPTQIVCRDDCRGLCGICGANLNEDPGHEHEREPDPRWAKLSEIRFD